MQLESGSHKHRSDLEALFPPTQNDVPQFPEGGEQRQGHGTSWRASGCPRAPREGGWSEDPEPPLSPALGLLLGVRRVSYFPELGELSRKTPGISTDSPPPPSVPAPVNLPSSFLQLRRHQEAADISHSDRNYLLIHLTEAQAKRPGQAGLAQPVVGHLVTERQPDCPFHKFYNE